MASSVLSDALSSAEDLSTQAHEMAMRARGTSPLVLVLVVLASAVCCVAFTAGVFTLGSRRTRRDRTMSSSVTPKRTPRRGRKVRYTRQARTEEAANKAPSRQGATEEEEEDDDSEGESEEDVEAEGASEPAKPEQHVNGQSNGQPEGDKAGEEEVSVAELLAKIDKLIPPHERKGGRHGKGLPASAIDDASNDVDLCS